MATGWCGWLMHPYTPNFSRTTSEFDTKILVGSMRTIGFCLNGQRFAPSNVGDLPWNKNDERTFVQVMYGRQIV